jgi:hypothetical protein
MPSRSWLTTSQLGHVQRLATFAKPSSGFTVPLPCFFPLCLIGRVEIPAREPRGFRNGTVSNRDLLSNGGVRQRLSQKDNLLYAFRCDLFFEIGANVLPSGGRSSPHHSHFGAEPSRRIAAHPTNDEKRAQKEPIFDTSKIPARDRERLPSSFDVRRRFGGDFHEKRYRSSSA